MQLLNNLLYYYSLNLTLLIVSTYQVKALHLVYYDSKLKLIVFKNC